MKKTFTNAIGKIFLAMVLLTTAHLYAQQSAQNKIIQQKDCFSPKAKDLNYIPVGQVFSETKSISPFSISKKIYSLALSADVKLDNKASLVRIILIDENATEHLVYETYPVIADSKSFTVENICEETSLLNGIVPVSLQIQTVNSSIAVKDLAVSYTQPNYKQGEFVALSQQIMDAQNDAKIEIINKKNKINGINWLAARTDVSHLPYDEKKMLINGIDGVLNFQGLEYYKEGIFVYDLGHGDAEVKEESSLTLIDHWDWKERHGANKPGSPYYDGDVNKGGWFTSIKHQGVPKECSHCWAFAPTATLEVLTNLYFNQHLDLDLSEQQAAACSGGASGSCAGGSSSSTANYIASTGLVDEACMPYKSSDGIACSSVCSSPTNKIKSGARVSLGSPTDDAMKKYIMDYGPVTSGVNGMWHFMCLEGFFKDPADGKNVWIFKNSYGLNSGTKGFLNIKITGSGTYDKLYGNFAFKTPFTSLKTYSVSCNDKDGDGYYWWGIGPKPSTCPVNSSNDKDSDDSDPCIGPLDADYKGIVLTGPNCLTNVFEPTESNINLKVFPNPATGPATLSYSLPSKAIIRLSILNLLGEETRVLVDNKELQEGFHSATIDNLGSGVFFCKLSFPNYSFTTKIVVIK